MSDQNPPHNPSGNTSDGSNTPDGSYSGSGGYPPPGNYPPPVDLGKGGSEQGYPQQGYQQQGYPQQQGGYQQGYPPAGNQYPPAEKKNTLGIVALVAAIVGILSCWTIVGGFLFGLVAIVLGFMARSKYKKGTATNGTMAIVSIILGAVAVVLSAVIIVAGVSLFNQIGGGNFLDCMNEATSEAERQQCADQFEQNVDDRFGVPSGQN